MIDPFATRLAWFAGMMPESGLALGRLRVGRIRHYAPRTDIICEGDPPRAVRVVVSGWACRYRYLSNGLRQIVALLLPGDVCDGHDGFEGADHTITALSGVVLGEIDPAAYAAVARSDDPTGRALRWMASVDLAIQREWTLTVGRRDAREGLAHLFCELYHRLDAVGLVEAGGYAMPLTQSDLADALGGTPVHVNRILQVLRREHLIGLRSRRLAIPNLGALQGVALFDPAYLHQHATPAIGVTQP